jgi:type II secretory ATPase GspE/PulE/Tfp pilus assembly ATPase PilB-like protein
MDETAPQQAPQAPAPPPPGGGIARLGDKLVEMGLISRDQLQIALYEKKRSNKMLGNLLIDLGFITESALSAVLAQSSGFERFDPATTMVEPELLINFPKEVAQRYRMLPVSTDGTSVRLAMADIYDVLALDQARRYLPPGVEIIQMVCAGTEIGEAIDKFYGYELSIDGILKEIETGKHDTSAAALSGEGYLHPLVRLVNAILLDAIKVGASDIHFEPEGMFLRLRYRIDGVMNQVRTIHKDHWPAISHRLKIVSGMNIADKLNPQDGRFSISIGNHKIDFRVAALPTVHGENIVLRTLDKSKSLVTISELGLSDHNLALLNRLLLRPEGIIIVTGPTGSGKTTTLYAILSSINSLEVNIMTLEDPVEYEMPLIRQAQVREGTSLTFSEGVRALLRQDPDIIFIGEVRDQATANMALRAAMTGHQVFSSLHTNDAPGALPRLLDLGLDPSLMSGNIIGILAQRLARRLCLNCRDMQPATPEECKILGADPANPPVIGYPVGCDQCRHTGYKGRVALTEILPMNKELDELIVQGASVNVLRKEAMKYGYVPMPEDGIIKVIQGIIGVESLVQTVDITDRL